MAHRPTAVPTIIDPNTGDFRIHGFVLGTHFTRPTFLASRLARRAQVVIDNDPWWMYSIGRRKLRDGETFFVSLQYQGTKLNQIHLHHDRPEYPTAYDELSGGGEQKRKAFHDNWCRQQLAGHGAEVVEKRHAIAYNFSWGGVSSEWPPQDGFCTLVVWYDEL